MRLTDCTKGGVVRLGDDPARCEEADDDVGQLVAAEGAPLPPRARRRGRRPRRSTSSPAQRGQVVQEVAHDESGLGLEERPAGVGPDEVEGVSHEAGDAVLGCPCGRQHFAESVGEPQRVVVRGGGQHVVLAREVAVQRTPRHPGCLGDLLHPQPPDTTPTDEAEGSDEDPLLGGTKGAVVGDGGSDPGSGVVQRHCHGQNILDSFCSFCPPLRVKNSNVPKTGLDPSSPTADSSMGATAPSQVNLSLCASIDRWWARRTAPPRPPGPPGWPATRDNRRSRTRR